MNVMMQQVRASHFNLHLHLSFLFLDILMKDFLLMILLKINSLH